MDDTRRSSEPSAWREAWKGFSVIESAITLAGALLLSITFLAIPAVQALFKDSVRVSDQALYALCAFVGTVLFSTVWFLAVKLPRTVIQQRNRYWGELLQVRTDPASQSIERLRELALPNGQDGTDMLLAARVQLASSDPGFQFLVEDIKNIVFDRAVAEVIYHRWFTILVSFNLIEESPRVFGGEYTYYHWKLTERGFDVLARLDKIARNELHNVEPNDPAVAIACKTYAPVKRQPASDQQSQRSSKETNAP